MNIDRYDVGSDYDERTGLAGGTMEVKHDGQYVEWSEVEARISELEANGKIFGKRHLEDLKHNKHLCDKHTRLEALIPDKGTLAWALGQDHEEVGCLTANGVWRSIGWCFGNITEPEDLLGIAWVLKSEVES